MRRKNTRPTLIYWLIDMRPETIAAGWHSGKPFYCGKTVNTAATRLRRHRKEALIWPARATAKHIIQCGEYVRMQIMETVPPDQDWCERERHWISLLRFSFPNVTNVADGGVGVPGNVRSPETRAKLSAAQTGKKHSAETLAKMSAARKGRKISSEHRKRLIAGSIAFHTGRKHSLEHREKISVGGKGKTRSAETRTNMRAAQQYRRLQEKQNA